MVLIVTLLLAVDSAYAPPYWIEFAIWIPLTLLLSLGLLQPVKGAVVAMQWQMGMHGFAKAKSERALGGRKQVHPRFALKAGPVS